MLFLLLHELEISHRWLNVTASDTLLILDGKNVESVY